MVGLVVHEWVEQSGGSEKVLDAILDIFPDAHLRVLWNDAPGRFSAPMSESWLAGTPLRRHKAVALPFMTVAWRGIRAPTEYEWILASSHAFAHHVRVRGQSDVAKLVYAHTPARYIWNPELDRRGQGPLKRLAAETLKPIDRRRAKEAAAIAANSSFTRERIRNTWGRDAAVIHPPVDVQKIRSQAEWASQLTSADRAIVEGLPSQFLLGASRFVSYKRLETAIDVGVAAGLPVVLAGSGPDRDLLASYGAAAEVEVHLVEAPSDLLLYALYQRASAFVFAAVEDFGIMPVEAMAAGTPVIAGSIGGATESVIEGVSGVLITDWNDPHELRRAVDNATSLNPTDVSLHAERFSRAAFEQRLAHWVSETV